MTWLSDAGDLHALVGELTRLAKQRLRRDGTFDPFGCTVTTDGEMTTEAGDGRHENPASETVIEQLVTEMRTQTTAGRIEAAGFCCRRDWWLGHEGWTDAIAVSAEHRGGERLLVVMPYSKGRFTGWHFGSPTAIEPSEPRVFSTPPQST